MRDLSCPEQFYEIGCKVKLMWTKDEIGDSEWRPGWYVGEVQQSDPDNDVIMMSMMFQACHLSGIL